MSAFGSKENIHHAEDDSHSCASRSRIFFYIDVQDSVLCLDQTKQYYFTMTDDELAKGKSVASGRYVSTHQRTLLSTVNTESCAVTLLHKRDNFSPMRDIRLIRLSNTVWT